MLRAVRRADRPAKRRHGCPGVPLTPDGARRGRPGAADGYGSTQAPSAAAAAGQGRRRGAPGRRPVLRPPSPAPRPLVRLPQNRRRAEVAEGRATRRRPPRRRRTAAAARAQVAHGVRRHAGRPGRDATHRGRVGAPRGPRGRCGEAGPLGVRLGIEAGPDGLGTSPGSAPSRDGGTWGPAGP